MGKEGTPWGLGKSPPPPTSFCFPEFAKFPTQPCAHQSPLTLHYLQQEWTLPPASSTGGHQALPLCQDDSSCFARAQTLPLSPEAGP